MEEREAMKNGKIPANPSFPTVHIVDRVRCLAGYPALRPRKEPLLDEVMADPIIRQLIAADDLSERDVRRTIERVQSGLRLEN
tara:strand:- start:4068 stop:4316 length:249 start_codon:yes stop_codon:yes gene_type:complete